MKGTIRWLLKSRVRRIYCGADRKLLYSYGTECGSEPFRSGSTTYPEHFNNDNMHIAGNYFKIEVIRITDSIMNAVYYISKLIYEVSRNENR